MKIVDEFEQTLEWIAYNPERGQAYFHDRGHEIVEVHTIWGAHRGRGPGL